MDSIILIFLCLIAGAVLRRLKILPSNSHAILNQFVINISMPGLALYYLPKIVLGTQLLLPLGVAWIGFVLSWLFFAGLGKWQGWPKRLIGCLVLTAGLGNTAFVGFPVIEALFGKQGLETAIVVDQPGTFVVVSTLGILVAAAYSKREAGTSGLLRKIVLFPPFIAFVIGLCMNLAGFDFHEALQAVFQRLGNTVTPVALTAVGMQLHIQRKSRHWGFVSLGLAFKLLLMPLFFFVLYRLALGSRGIVADVSIMESAMAPMITAAILASIYGLKPKLAGMMIGVGIPVSFITMAFWYWLLIIFN
ncbi:AEC family transporter [Flavobacterium sp. MFBS3-15]|uniref:AEC family transporter n=1 Tax=Flavobacterium sp. MFBS3-15 TaxID=2989816 RepID=UPI002235E5AE|nr:AEC family transporter [Flavobacterium sp. MFBS3-15]MCW4469128.1 AEC family transporter [Flavobacterium sp. MFBS3-15]